MPFQVFRRHQRKMMAFLAIFAMVAFTLDFSLFRSQFGAAAQDRTVVELYGRRVRQSDIAAMQFQRARANEFMEQLTGRRDYFGPLDSRAIVDALILQHEADRLGMPVSKDLGVQWLRTVSQGQLTTATFDRIYRRSFADRVTDVQLLEEIANQVRLSEVASLPGFPPVTPLDVYQAYRDQDERVAAQAVAFRVDDYIPRVPDPTPAEVEAYFNQYKDQLPDPARDTPGFKVPHRIRAEFVQADAEALARDFQQKLTEDELRQAYKDRPDDFLAPEPELPANLFADDPDAKLTPRLTDPFESVRSLVTRTLARERAQEQIDRLFGQLRDEVIVPFSEKYGLAQDQAKEAEEAGRKAEALPAPGTAMKQAAAKLGLRHEQTPLLDRELANNYGQIGAARRGGGPLGGGTTFADEMMTKGLYEEAELTDGVTGRRFLAWKIADAPARVPKLDEARAEVVYALKRDKARELARKDAEALAKQARDAGGDLAQAAGTTHTVIRTSPVPKVQPGLNLGPGMSQPARPSEILNIPDAGDELREEYFDLEPKEVAVAPNAPKTVYYVLALDQRVPAPFEGLYSPFGPQMTLRNEVLTDALIRRSREWMQELRRRAQLDPNWIPPEEKARAERESA